MTFAPKDLEFTAELLGELAYNDTLRGQVLKGQRTRLAAFSDASITTAIECMVAAFA